MNEHIIAGVVYSDSSRVALMRTQLEAAAGTAHEEHSVGRNQTHEEIEEENQEKHTFEDT